MILSDAEAGEAMEAPLLSVRDLHTAFDTPGGVAHVLSGVSMTLQKGSITGLVGETGSGKTVTATSILRLVHPPGRIVSGEIVFDGEDLLQLSDAAMARVRGRQATMIFQQPRASLNPVFRIQDTLLGVLRTHRGLTGTAARQEAQAALRAVGLPDPRRVLTSFPHELSGGMCQRVMIALALSCQPRFLIADEPTTSLDVTIQAQILELLQSLRENLHLTLLLITHDLGVVAEVCDDVVVLYAGEVMEKAPVEALFDSPRHPYTAGLLGSLPSRQRRSRLISIPGTVPDLIRPPSGCRFHPRCPHARAVCAEKAPVAEEASPGHIVRCHFWRDIDARAASS